MKILFIIPPFGVTDIHRKIEVKIGFMPLIGIASLATVLKKRGYEVKVLDLQLYNYGLKELTDYIRNYSPNIIGFPLLTPLVPYVFELIKGIKSKSAGKIVLGGPHATILPEETLRDSGADFVVVGEGEYTLLELVKALEKDQKFDTVKGLLFKDNGKVVFTGKRELIKNLDELPIPSREFYEINRYIPYPNQYKKLPTTSMITARGCMYGKCAFCFESALPEHIYRRVSVNRAIEEIGYLKSEYGMKEITFWDDEFVMEKGWVEEFCESLIREKIDIKWSCYARAGLVTRSLLQKMASAGCWNIYYGLESGNQKLLNIMKKGQTLQQMRDAIKWTHEAGIEARGSFILGLPGETPDIALETIKFALSLDLDYGQFNLCTPYPGTILHKMCREYGNFSANSYDEYTCMKPIFLPVGYKNREQLLKMQKLAYRKIYFRLRYILKSIKRINSWSELKRHFKGLFFLIKMRVLKNRGV
jgi:anaerobic magnesium-protoporphyrin IX monomethyl ester cyclase